MDRCHRKVTTPSIIAVTLRHSMPGAGAVHHIIGSRLISIRSLGHCGALAYIHIESKRKIVRRLTGINRDCRVSPGLIFGRWESEDVGPPVAASPQAQEG
jgi:hypothetical protein